MQYFTNRQITEQYNVSFDAVRGWIDAARDGKNDLRVGQSVSGKWQIANTSKNAAIITSLVARNKSRKNRLSRQAATPKRKFYTLYSPAQQADIISSIEAYREIPVQYGYFDSGAAYWDEYEQRLLNEESLNSLKYTIELLDANLANIERFAGRRQVNVIDLGVGNALPVRGLLGHLLKRGVLGRYVGIDISPEMLKIAEKHITTWFGDKVPVETHLRDITAEGFKDLLADDYLKPEEVRPINLILLFGGTILNVRRPQDILNLANASMSPGDMFLCTHKLDTASARRHFDFNADEDAAALSGNDRTVIDLLGINPAMYDVEQLYDDATRARLIRIRMKLDVSIQFDFPSGERHLELSKNDVVTLWRAWHLTARESGDQLEAAGFELLNSSVTSDSEYLLTVSRPSVIKPNR